MPPGRCFWGVWRASGGCLVDAWSACSVCLVGVCWVFGECLVADGWMFGWRLQELYESFPAETRLTVYRRRQVAGVTF